VRIVGLTGGIGSGKSVVAELFRHLGVDVVDADEVAHQLSAAGQPGATAVIAAFGPVAGAPDGSLNRAWLREHTFADPAFRKRLEDVLHPLIAAEIGQTIASWRGSYGIVSAPLLLERGNLLKHVDRVLVVDAPEAEQVRRAAKRGAMSTADVRAILVTQMSRSQRLARADDVIDNSGALADLVPQVSALDQKYRAQSTAGRL
jgi:dephospho-CoA kinase